jgi:hypothetical protein
MKRRTLVVLLCEDVEQRSFFEGLCKRLGFVSRVIRVLVAPPGKGAAEQWVRAQYPREVRAYRAKENHLTNGLLAAIDGDARGVIARKAQLDEALAESEQDPRHPEDRIATCVPTWSIETWLAWLCGSGDVDERTPYKNEPSYRRAREAGSISAKDAIEGWFSAVRAGEPPSLTDGRHEIERLRARNDERPD